jgi:hypothetical protein
VKLWTEQPSDTAPVDEADSSPGCTHSAIPLPKREQDVVPVLHTPYDYDKGFS